MTPNGVTIPQLYDLLALAIDARFGAGVCAAIFHESEKPVDDIKNLLAGSPVQITRRKSPEELIAAGIGVDASAPKPSTPATPAPVTPAAPNPSTPALPSAPAKAQTVHERFAAISDPAERARFAEQNEYELKGGIPRDTNLTALQQFQMITDARGRGLFYAKFESEILACLSK